MQYFYQSPLGGISYELLDNGQCSHLTLIEPNQPVKPEAQTETPVSKWLDSYFNGRILALPALEKPHTAFQKKLRQALLDIPIGERRTYGELSRQLGTAPRALGQALAANPLPILIPCHRVVAASGIGGFSCGIEWKKSLLKFEHGC
jgi:methylated-DNA-[protein]-cysteine S-methyltransferase